MSFRRRAALACALLTLAACSDRGEPLAPSVAEPTPAPRFELSCRANVAARTVECRAPRPSGVSADLIVGEQGTYVQLASSNVAITADTFAFDVTVQNLIPQSMGTTDGTTLDPAGVRVFFHVLPVATQGAGDVEVANADGFGTFTLSNQPYYQYDEVLAQNQTSAPKNWKLRFDPTVEAFAFTLYVAAEVQYPAGYVELSPSTPNLLTGSSQALTAVVRTAVGNLASDQTVAWGSSDPLVATVDASGNVTAVKPGQVTVTATAGSRSGSTTIDVCPNLAVGEAYAASMPSAARLCVGGQGSTAEYTYMPVNLSTSSALSLTLTATGIQAVTGPPSPDRIPAASSGLRLADAPAAGDLAILERSARETRHLVGNRAARV
ncbi:MAG TPA: Ig-like domain-containing protein, partial [Longimicrobium sp.]|nr:Ig-like domain-containing protein [Longimicrobium sp.]